VCWGIEIGAAAIKAVKLEATGDGVRATDYAVIQHPKVLSEPGVNPADVLKVSLGQLVNQCDFSKASVAVSIPGHSGFARFAKLPPVEPKKVPEIVRFEAMQQVPFPLEQVEWDYQTFVTPDSPEVEVGIFAVTKEKVAERLQMLTDVGINASHVVLSPIAVYNALSYDLEFGPTTPGTIIVDVGTTSTDLVIATPGRMWVRTFPMGGHQFTQALVDQFQLSYAKAEKLKREAEDSKHARQVFQAMRPVFTDMAQDIQRSIGYFQTLHKDVPLTRLIGVGSTFQLPGLRKYLKQQLGMDVYRIEELKKLPFEGDKDPAKKAAWTEASLTLVTAYGLALQGLGENAVGGNLMPVAVLRKAMWKDKIPTFAAAAGLAIAAGAVMFVTPVRNYFVVNGPDGASDAVVRTALNRASQLRTQATEAGVLEAGAPDMRGANVVALMQNRQVFDYIAADVVRMLESGEAAAARSAPASGEAAPSGPIFTLTRLDSTYEPPVSADAMALADPSASGEDTDPLKIAAYPRIKLELLLDTHQPETSRFVRDTLDRWLRTNQKRDGIPYELRAGEPSFSVKLPRTSIASSSADPVEGADRATRPMGRGVARGDQGVMGESMSTDDFNRMMSKQVRDTSRFGAVVGGNAPADPVAQKQSEAAAKAMSEVEALAPIAGPAATKGDPAKVTLTFYAVFVPPAPAEGDANGGGN
jgi:type IV pilus assembly protein PilM